LTYVRSSIRMMVWALGGLLGVTLLVHVADWFFTPLLPLVAVSFVLAVGADLVLGRGR
jgi:hypothetical protein